MIFLSDLDGVGADWDSKLDHHATTDYAHIEGIPLRHERKSFTFYDEVEPDVRTAILEIMNLPTYYAELEPVPGWAEAMHRIADMGHEVFIVTSPWLANPDCTRDKLNWVAKVLGEGWRKRVILTGDKTVVRGDILVDDKPNIQGAVAHGQRSWQHVLFDQPYNRAENLPRITDWRDWPQIEEVLTLVGAP